MTRPATMSPKLSLIHSWWRLVAHRPALSGGSPRSHAVMSIATSNAGSMRTTNPSHARLTRISETPCPLDVSPGGRAVESFLTPARTEISRVCHGEESPEMMTSRYGRCDGENSAKVMARDVKTAAAAPTNWSKGPAGAREGRGVRDAVPDQPAYQPSSAGRADRRREGGDRRRPWQVPRGAEDVRPADDLAGAGRRVTGRCGGRTQRPAAGDPRTLPR